MVRIVIMGSRQIRHRTGCCGSRTQEEIVLGYIPNLYRTFGQRHISCRYVDIDDAEAASFGDTVEAVRNKKISLPLAVRDQELILHGQSTLFQLPDYIREALKAEGERESPRPGAAGQILPSQTSPR